MKFNISSTNEVVEVYLLSETVKQTSKANSKKSKDNCRKSENYSDNSLFFQSESFLTFQSAFTLNLEVIDWVS